MKQAMVLSGMSHVMIKLFAPWVSWKVLPYSGRIALLFVLHTVAFLIITRITVCWRCFFSIRQRNGRKYVSFSRNFLWRRRRYQFRGRRWLGCRTRCPLLLRFVFRSYSMRIALEDEIGFEITGITKLFHFPSPQPLIISWKIIRGVSMETRQTAYAWRNRRYMPPLLHTSILEGIQCPKQTSFPTSNFPNKVFC